MTRKTRFRFLTMGVLLLLPLTTAIASSDTFHFDVEEDDFGFHLSLFGSDDPGVVQVDWTGAPKPMPHRRYYIEFNRAKKQMYLRPAQADGLPWFEVDVIGRRGDLLIGNRRFSGSVDWTPGARHEAAP